MRYFLIVLLCCVVFYHHGTGETPSESNPLILPYEHGFVNFIDKKKSEKRADQSFLVLKEVQKNGNALFTVREEGEGNYDIYENVTWVTEALMEEKDDILYPLVTSRTFTDRKGELIIRKEKRFDYENKKVIFKAKDGKGHIVSEKTFPIKGNTFDDVTLVYCLKAYAINRNKEEYKKFFLVTGEPSFYKIKVKDMGKEKLDLPIGTVESIKLRLIIKKGLLTGLAKLLVPPTFVWYADQEPYRFLQYEGLECGLGSTLIVVHLTTE